MQHPSPLRSATLSADRIAADRNGRRILSDISLVLVPRSCLGIVGPNGVGKSTLLRMLAGELAPASGLVRRDPPDATVGLLAQEHGTAPGVTVGEHLGRALGIEAAEAELGVAAAALAGGDSAAARYEAALERYLALGAADFEARLLATLDDLGLGAERAEQSVESLSGGERARVALAAVVLSRFDITLLDEPTNDLDFDGLELLERFVSANPGGLAVVSHDRAFLQRCVGEVLELDEHDGRAAHYGGGWSGYLAERAASAAHAREAYESFESRRSLLTERAQREREWATQGVKKEKKKAGRDNDKLQRDFRLNRTEKLAARARRTERAMAALDTVEKPFEGWQLHYAIGQAPRAGAVVARLEQAVLERGSFRLGPIDLEIAWGERVALVGPNGSGKTSLVQAILARLPLTSGTRWIGPSVVTGELAQDRSAGEASAARSGGAGATGKGAAGRSVLDELIAATRLSLSDARSLLSKFGLEAGDVTRPAASLSAGERTRAQLARFQAQGVNFLVLDEPTNHLDLPAIEQLEAALDGFTGTLLLVSHDRALLEAIELTRHVSLGEMTVAETSARAEGIS